MAQLIDLFNGFYQVFIDKDVPKVMKLFAHDATILGPGFTFSGKDAIQNFFESEARKVDGYTIEKKSILEKGDEIAVEWKVTHRYKPSPKEIRVNGVTLIKAEKGLIKNLRDYTDLPPSQTP
jgi:ketosteroid isomerase-like protein